MRVIDARRIHALLLLTERRLPLEVGALPPLPMDCGSPGATGTTEGGLATAAGCAVAVNAGTGCAGATGTFGDGITTTCDGRFGPLGF